MRKNIHILPIRELRMPGTPLVGNENFYMERWNNQKYKFDFNIQFLSQNPMHRKFRREI